MTAIGSRVRLLVAGVTLVAGSAFAQAPPRRQFQRHGSARVQVRTRPVPSRLRRRRTLSERLNQSNGVIHPKEVDPAIEKPAPQARDPNVVPPPGTSDGAPAPQPK